MLTATCHCRAVSVTIPRAPGTATNCNCSHCRRLGALWGYFEVREVAYVGHPGNTQEYIQGDRMLRTIRCRTCGNTICWEPLPMGPDKRMAVNLRLFEPEVLGDFRIRRFDGARSWRFVDGD